MTRRILVGAYACEPGKGSEQGVGWNWVNELAKTDEVWVVTRSNNRTGIAASEAANVNPRLHFVYFDLPPWVTRLKNKERGLYLYYLFWQIGALAVSQKLARLVKFDYCMHLTFGSVWLPTFLHRLGIPFIWGPLGGGEGVPRELRCLLSPAGRVVEFVRELLQRSLKINPMFTGPARAAVLIIARTRETAAIFPKRYHHKVRLQLETGMPEAVRRADTSILESCRGSSVLQVIYSGRLIGIKNVDMAVRAFAELSRSFPAKLTILGDGPLRTTLEARVAELGIQRKVLFRGSVTQAEVLDQLAKADVFLFPSLKEGGTWSLMEAMMAQLPVICINSSGMRIITDEGCAIRIDPGAPSAVLADMVKALISLAGAPELRRTMGVAGRLRIERDFAWSSKGKFLRSELDAVEAERG